MSAPQQFKSHTEEGKKNRKNQNTPRGEKNIESNGVVHLSRTMKRLKTHNKNGEFLLRHFVLFSSPSPSHLCSWLSTDMCVRVCVRLCVCVCVCEHVVGNFLRALFDVYKFLANDERDKDEKKGKHVASKFHWKIHSHNC